MRRGFVLVMMMTALTLAGCGGGGKKGAVEQPPVDPDSLQRRGFVESEDGRLRISGKSPLVVSVRVAGEAPPLPAGWEALAPVYDITARDRLKNAVHELPERLSIAFETRPGVAASVLVYDADGWQVVPSDLAGSKVTAQVDHLTPYTVGAPKAAQGGLTGPATATPTPTLTPTPPPATAARGRTATATLTPAVATMGPAQAQALLEAAAAKLKGRAVRVDGAAGYTGTLMAPLPLPLQQALGVALAAGGACSLGMYNGINQAVTVTAAAGSAVGTLTLLAEPTTQMPSSESAARGLVTRSFPGVPVGLSAVNTPAGYAFAGQAGGISYVAGVVNLNGAIVVYAASGSGTLVLK